MNIQNEQLATIQALLYDKNFRADLQANPEQHAPRLGYQLGDEQTIKIVVNTSATIHFILPDINSVTDIDINSLQQIYAAGSASTIGTGGTGMCCGSACSSFSSVSTAGTIGTGGTAGDKEISELF